jgi:hypothetical protein
MKFFTHKLRKRNYHAKNQFMQEGHAMNTNDMRGHVIAAYGGSDKWKRKVLRMSDTQVLAIYKRLQAKGKVK